MDQPALPAETDDDEGGHVATKSREGLVAALADDPGSSLEMLILQELLNREGKSFSLQGVTVLERIDTVYRRAGYDKHWGVVRRGAGLLHKTVDSLAPGITTILVSGKVVTIGVFGHAEKVIYEPLTPSMIQVTNLGDERTHARANPHARARTHTHAHPHARIHKGPRLEPGVFILYFVNSKLHWAPQSCVRINISIRISPNLIGL